MTGLSRCPDQQTCFHSKTEVRLQVASHLVGVSTSAKTPKGSAASFCRIGRAKAAVFPLPVWAVPSTSLPARMAGMQPCCTSVGFTMPREQHTLEATDSVRDSSLQGLLGHEALSTKHNVFASSPRENLVAGGKETACEA